MHGARILQIDGNFDDCLELARKIADRLPGRARELGEPGPHRGPEDGRVRDLRRARRRARHALPPGRQRRQHHRVLEGLHRVHRDGRRPAAAHARVAGGGRGADRAGEPVPHPETIATAIRIGNPRRGRRPIEARERVGRPHRRGHRREILDAYRLVARRGGVRRARVGRVGRRPAPGASRTAGSARARRWCARSPARSEGPAPR